MKSMNTISPVAASNEATENTSATTVTDTIEGAAADTAETGAPAADAAIDAPAADTAIDAPAADDATAATAPAATPAAGADAQSPRALLKQLQQQFPAFRDCLPLAIGIDKQVVARLPEGPRYYDSEQLTDRGLRWHAAELVRAELWANLGEELPYSCAVTVTQWQEREDHDRVRATIHVERDSQKGIVVGKGGRLIKKVSIASRERIEALTGRRCDLRLTVAVARDWTRDPAKLAQLGYRDPEGT